MAKYILFVCTENSARSQMAEGFFNFYNKNQEYIGMSAGTNPAKSIKPYAIEVMKEKWIDIAKQEPKIITPDIVEKAYLIFTMGCARGCPVTPPEKTEDWSLKDPDERPIEKFREIRDAIEQRIEKLISELHQEILYLLRRVSDSQHPNSPQHKQQRRKGEKHLVCK